MSRERVFMIAVLLFTLFLAWIVFGNTARGQTAGTVAISPEAVCYPTLDPSKAYPSKLPLLMYRTDGMVLYWYCWSGTSWVAVFRSMHVDSLPTFLATAGAASIDAVIARDTKVIGESSDPRKTMNDLTVKYTDTNPASSCANHIANNGSHKAFCEAIFATLNANVPSPLSQWIVAPAQYADGTRPTYASRNGALVFPPNGRIAAGSPCNCSISVGVEPYRYCSVNGKPDQLALCRKAT